MKSLFILLALCMLASLGAASLTMYEAGKVVICVDDDLEVADPEWSMFETYPSVYFEPIDSREQVQDNFYKLHLNKIMLMEVGDVTDAMIDKPTSIMISDKPLVGSDLFSFEGQPVKNVTVGKLGLVNTTLYTGEWSSQTPHFVTFEGNGFYCCIYNQDISMVSFTEQLARIDVLAKTDLPTYLSRLWHEVI